MSSIHSLLDRVPLARGSLLVLATHISGVALSYVAQILMVRWAGPDAFGLFSMAFAGATVLALIAGSGMPDAIVRLIPEYVTDERWTRLRDLMNIAERWVVGLAVFLAIALGLATAAFYGGIPALSTSPGVVALGGLAVAPVLVLHHLYTNACRAQHQLATAYGLGRVGRQLLIIGGTAAVAYGHPSMLNGPGLVVITAGSLTVVAVLQRTQARRLYSRRRNRDASESRGWPPPVRWGQARRWIQFALPFFFTHGFFSLFHQTDLLLIGVFAPIADVGHYRISIHMAALVSFVLAAVNTTAAPHFAARYAENDVDGLRSMTRRLIPWIVGASLVVFLGVVGIGPFLLSLFGPSFQAAYLPLIILASGHLFSALCGPVDTLLYMTNRQQTAAWIIVGSVAVNLFLSAIGLVFFGLVGAAIASTVCIVAWNLAFVRIARHRIGIDPSILSIW